MNLLQRIISYLSCRFKRLHEYHNYKNVKVGDTIIAKCKNCGLFEDEI